MVPEFNPALTNLIKSARKAGKVLKFECGSVSRHILEAKNLVVTGEATYPAAKSHVTARRYSFVLVYTWWVKRQKLRL